MNKIFYIYKLHFLEIPNVAYIGKTCNMRRRYLEHIGDARRGTGGKLYSWVRKNLKLGYELHMDIIDSTRDEKMVNLSEIVWIAAFKKKGYELKNSTSGGEGILNPSEDVRRKISDAGKGEKNPFYGKRHSEEAKRRIGEHSRNRVRSEESNIKRSKSQKGKSVTEETKVKREKARKKMHYKILSPSGEEFETDNLQAFCKERGIQSGHLSKLGKTKGYILLDKIKCNPS